MRLFGAGRNRPNTGPSGIAASEAVYGIRSYVPTFLLLALLSGSFFLPALFDAAVQKKISTLQVPATGNAAPVIFLGVDPDTTEGCICLNNASGPDDGQFQQTISILAPAGQNWTVTGVSGFYDLGSAPPPADPAPVPVGAVIPEVAVDSGLYQLTGLHLDGAGFSITAANEAGDVLTIGNTCYYPNVQIVGLPDQLCMSSAPVVLTADAGGAQGTGVFTVDGQPAAVFDPYLLGAGSHTVTYIFDAGAGAPGDPADPGCSQTVNQDVHVLPGPVIITNDLVNVSLGDACYVELVADEILEGTYDCEDDFVVTVFDIDGNPIGNAVTSDQVGQTLMVQVTTQNGPYSGMGQVLVEDKLKPSLQSCAPPTDQATISNQVQEFSGALDNDDPTFLMSNFACYDAVAGANPGAHYFELDTLTVDLTDVYTLELNTDFGVGGAGIYLGDFSATAGPCQGLVATSRPLPAGLGSMANSSETVYLRALLQAGQRYTLLTSSAAPGVVGSFVWTIYSAGDGLADSLSVDTGLITLPLFCGDAGQLLNNPLSMEYTGSPVAADNCTDDFAITFTDELSDAAICGADAITRTFSIADGAGNTVQCEQVISMPSPGTDDVVLPPKRFFIPCDQPFPETDDGNPAPALTGYPFVMSAFGPHELAPVYCNLSATFTDQPHVPICDGAYSFVRRWFILDQCDAASGINFDQIIQIGDLGDPIVTSPNVDIDFDGTPDPFLYAAGNFDCTAAFQAPLPNVVDNCSGFQVFTEVLSQEILPVINQVGQVVGQDTQTVVLATIPASALDRYVAGIPVGCHNFRFTVTDNCNNIAVTESTFCVVDNLEPIAVCDDELTVSVGGNGIGRLYAEDLDEGSSDNCGSVILQVRRRVTNDPLTCDPVTPYFTPWAESVEFGCCDVGQAVPVELRVVDESGNANTCLTAVDIVDNALPSCQPPQAASIVSSALPQSFEPTNVTHLQLQFGIPSVADNCNASFTELTPQVNLNDCGFGSILRQFRAVDQFGNFSGGVCQQLVLIAENHSYQIKFPADAQVDDCSLPQADSIEILHQGSEEFAVNIEDQVFDASGSACYKIFRTFEVINWCEYNGDADAIEVSRDADCDGLPGDEAVWVTVRSDGVTFYDRDEDENNNAPSASVRGTACDGQTNPAGYWKSSDLDPDIASTGRWRYTQVIKVHDDTAPEVVFDPPAPFCSSNNVDCDGAVSIDFAVVEACSPEALTVQVFLDVNNDGDLDQEVTGNVLSGNNLQYTLSGNFPIGDHGFEVRVNDGCGNTAAVNIPFSVADCFVSAPVCITGISTELMSLPPGTDADGDGDTDQGARTIPVNSFLDTGLLSDCSGPVTFSINRVGETPDPDRSALTVTCDDLGVVLVEIYAWDDAENPYSVQPDGQMGGPNFDFCESFLLVQDNQFNLCNTITAGIAGGVFTEGNEPVEHVMVNLNGPTYAEMMTPGEGGFLFENLEGGYDYSLAAYSDDDPDNGVTTLDLVLMTKHILGVQSLDSPYKLIAADVNQSGAVTTLDVIQLRKLILGIISDLPNNNSWRFVDAAYVFPDPEDPWFEDFPEVVSINNLDGMITGADFVAVKIGDVNGSAQPNSAMAIDDRAIDGVVVLELPDQVTAFGEKYRLAIHPGAGSLSPEGIQFTLHLHPAYLRLESVRPGLFSGENFGWRWSQEGVLTVSWHGAPEDWLGIQGPLFTLEVSALRAGKLSDALSISSAYTAAEAYGSEGEVLGVELHFPDRPTDGFKLFQNQPNPFRDETLIGFTIPRAGAVSLIFTDISGREVKRFQRFFESGYHHFSVGSDDLPDHSILFYTLETADFSATKKMIKLE